ncbi:MAG: ATP-binding protein [Pseudomonadota bacterium]|nr:ATP-binding protein [Pseudomonadota bacterium]
MASEPAFASIGSATNTIDVRLSYRIIELFSEGLYASSNKAVEELVANSFDAGAQRAQVLLSPNLHEQSATIVVIDDGEGMDVPGLKQHWLIGISNKRRLSALPQNRQQIGKFGIGKLATYVLANRLTHLSKRGGRYHSTSMDFNAIDKRVDKEIEPKRPVRMALRELTEQEAKQAVKSWTDTPAFKASGMKLFGTGVPPSWTVAVMSTLKPKVHEIKPGILEWVLRTALSLRPDFGIWLNGTKLVPSKQGKGLLRTWILGKDMIQLPKPSPKGVSASEDSNVPMSSEHRHGIDVPGLGRITGYTEAYKDLLTGKSDELGRSYGFFVYVYGRLVNVVDGHFGISPDELRHGTFGRFRLVVHIDALDQELRSNREAISEGPLLATAQDVLRAIFNAVRPTLEKHDEGEEPGAKLGRHLAASPGSLSRRPILDLARAVVEGRAKSRFLIVPEHKSSAERNAFLTSLEQRTTDGEEFVTGLTIDYNGSPEDGIARYDTATGVLRINAWHPFVATFHDEFASKGVGQPLELFAMAEVLAESHLHTIGVKSDHIEGFLSLRDQLLRTLASGSGRQSAFALSLALRNARNNPDALEDRLCAAFRSLGFEVTPIGGKGKPDGVATALLSADGDGTPRQYAVSLEAKSKEKDHGKVAAGTVKVSAIVRQREDYRCQHALVVGRAFPTSKGDASALAKEIDDDRKKTNAIGEPKTITLITIDDLATLVRLRPVKQIGLLKLRKLFQQCKLPKDSANWVASVKAKAVKKPPYKRIVTTIEGLQKKFKRASVKYAALRVELSHLSPAIEYETDDELIDLCKAMAQMAPGAMFATSASVELDQSAENVIAAIDATTKDYPAEEL